MPTRDIRHQVEHIFGSAHGTVYPLCKAAGIIEDNMKAGRIPDDDFLLLASHFNPRNTACMSADEMIVRLDLDQTETF